MKKANVLFKVFLVVGLGLLTLELMRSSFNESVLEQSIEDESKLKKLEKWLGVDVYRFLEQANTLEWTGTDGHRSKLSDEELANFKKALLDESNYSFDFVKSAPLIVNGTITLTSDKGTLQLDVSTFARKIVFPPFDGGRPVIDYLGKSDLAELINTIEEKI